MNAYSLCVFGNPEYLKGAAALASSIRRSGTKYDILLLVTEDVRRFIIHEELFTRIVTVPYLTSPAPRLSAKQRKIYHSFITNVVTKLNGIRVGASLGYSKVILLDVDMIFVANCDHLFDIPAPAACWGVPNGITPELDNLGTWISKEQIDRQFAVHSFVCSGALLIVEASQREFDRLFTFTVDPYNPSGPEEQLFARYAASYYNGCNVVPNDYNFIPWKRYPRPIYPKIYHFHSSKPWAIGRNAWPDLKIWWDVYDQL